MSRGAVFGGAETDVGIAKVGFGITGRLGLFFDKENTPDLVGNIAEEVLVAVTRTLVAEFTITVEMTEFFQHEDPPVRVNTVGF